MKHTKRKTNLRAFLQMHTLYFEIKCVSIVHCIVFKNEEMASKWFVQNQIVSGRIGVRTQVTKGCIYELFKKHLPSHIHDVKKYFFLKCSFAFRKCFLTPLWKIWSLMRRKLSKLYQLSNPTWRIGVTLEVILFYS